MTQPPESGQSVPASADQARELVLRKYAAPSLPDGTPVPLHVHEFEEGYLVYPVYPAVTDPTSPPREPGGSNFVVAKATGDITTVPNYPVDQAVDTYRRLFRPGSTD